MMAYVEDCIYGGKWMSIRGKKTLIKNSAVKLEKLNGIAINII